MRTRSNRYLSGESDSAEEWRLLSRRLSWSELLPRAGPRRTASEEYPIAYGRWQRPLRTVRTDSETCSKGICSASRHWSTATCAIRDVVLIPFTSPGGVRWMAGTLRTTKRQRSFDVSTGAPQ